MVPAMPYSVEVAKRRLHGLIRWTANHYAVPGNPKLNRDDLEAEGLLMLVECCQKFPEGQQRFIRYFKRSWYNRLRDLSRDERRQKRRGITVELDEAFSKAHVRPEAGSDTLKKLKPYLSHRICATNSVTAYQLLNELVEPSEAVSEYAWREFCRKNKLHGQGRRVKDIHKFRITERHVQKALGLSRQQVLLGRQDAKDAYLLLAHTKRGVSADAKEGSSKTGQEKQKGFRVRSGRGGKHL